mgnify:FL=1
MSLFTMQKNAPNKWGLSLGAIFYLGANATTNIPIAVIGKTVNKVTCVKSLTIVTPVKPCQTDVKNKPVIKTEFKPAKILMLNTPLLN